MNNEEKDIEFIERYLEEKLSQEEENDFQSRLLADKQFEKDFFAYKALIGGIKYAGKNAVLQKMKKIEASITIQESFDKNILGIPTKYLYPYSAAATILLLISFTFIFILQHRSSPEDIFSENFQAYPNVIQPSTRSEKTDKSEEEQALYLYDLEKYHEAQVLLKRIYERKKDPVWLFYLANSYMATGKFDESTKALETLIKSDSQFKIQGMWYLSLSYLAKNEPIKAKEILKKLKGGNNSYSKKADAILRNLE